LARFNSSNSQAGFSLVEAIVATGLMAGALASLGQMFAISIANNVAARAGTYATVLAEQKMEQLRGLTWGFDILGLPISDSSTNTARPVEAATGGTGLAPSPSNTLTANVDGYVDYIDQFGNIIGGGTTVPPKTMFIRRWSVEPLPVNPNNTLILQVLVTKRLDRGVADTVGSVQRLRDEARLMTVKTRKAL
jgi:type II secretory pathway pseudopilin PulG